MGAPKTRTAAPDEIARTFLHRESEVVAKPRGPAKKPDTTKKPDVDATAETLPPPPMSEAPAARYVFVREMGRGGMGRVDEIFDTLLGRGVAQKASLAGVSEKAATMLIAEAQVCAQLEHPSIVPVYDLGAGPEGQPFYTMRKVRGRTLREVLGEGSRTLAQLLGVLRQVCLAVDYAHSRKVVHRDLKPDNVIVGEFGEVYVLDWGIADVLEGSDVMRTELERFHAGSPGYMAPEQAVGGEITPATDVFALGAMLYELVSGVRPFDDTTGDSIRARAKLRMSIPPSKRAEAEKAAASRRGGGGAGADEAVRVHEKVTDAFDALVDRCLQPAIDDRVQSARVVADAIDHYLDGERARAEREKEAEQHTLEGEGALAKFEGLHAAAERLRDEAEAMLAEIPAWESAEAKQPAWDLEARGKQAAADAARALARANAAFTRAIGRVAEHKGARRGLAALHYRQFLDAEEARDAERMAMHLELARAYDDGPLALELRNEGELVVVPSEAVEMTVARYVPNGPRLVLDAPRALGAGEAVRLEVGSYLVIAKAAGRADVRYPLLVHRAMRHELSLRIPHVGEIPDDMVLVPGGPFLAPASPRSARLVEHTLPDFAIGRFPVTFREYVRFMESIADEGERKKRTPRDPRDEAFVFKGEGGWRLRADFVEGAAKARVPVDRELDLPVCYVNWFDATAYAAWRSKLAGTALRLPSDLEWEKAMRGADGRAFSMGDQLDPGFAKLRESRAEAPQPEPVGSFAIDQSPYAVRDLTGGVGDWTSTSADGSSLLRGVNDESTQADTRQAVWRGGAWSTTALHAHRMRFASPARLRYGWVGMRVAMQLPSSSSVSRTRLNG